MNKHMQTRKNIESLINQLLSKDDEVRINARKSLIVIGKPAVPALSLVMLNSKVHKARWEAAKALGEIGHTKAIPSLVKALEDTETDVVWLAAVALEKFGKIAWHELLTALKDRGAESVMLRNGAHHVLLKQRAEGFDNLLVELRKALKSPVSESTPMAAFKILEKLP
ncbi:MAG: HEAT repeat domain-containing protein [Prolixibacteraceae bacterium]